MSKYVWKVVFLNEEMGFRKVTFADAVGYSQAVTFAGDKLERKGYSRYDFQVIEVTRGTRVADGSPAGCQVVAAS